jgi:hypothetical protein
VHQQRQDQEPSCDNQRIHAGVNPDREEQGRPGSTAFQESSSVMSQQVPPGSKLNEAEDTWTDLDVLQQARAHKHQSQIDTMLSDTGSTHIRTVSQLQKTVGTVKFESVFGLVILTNAILMGVQADIVINNPGEEIAIHFYVINYLYGLIFTVELCLRLTALGCRDFIVSQNWFWNYVDIGVVLSCWCEFAVDVHSFAQGASSDGSGLDLSILRMMRFLRIARLARIVKLGRMMKIIRAFRVLIFSIQTTLRTVVWALLLLLVLIYIFALMEVQLVSDHHDESSEGFSPEVELFWGTLPTAMFTLFKSVAGGLSWHDCLHPLWNVHWSCVLLFVVFISFIVLAILNVISGVFCASAMEAAEHDKELAVQKHIDRQKEYVVKIRELFKDIDTDNSEVITLDEFEKHLEDDDAAAFFSTLQIDADTAWDLFKLLDADEGGSIDIDEFVSGCVRLRGTAKALDVAKLHHICLRTDKLLVQLDAQVKALSSRKCDSGTLRESVENLVNMIAARTVLPYSPASHLQSPRNAPVDECLDEFALVVLPSIRTPRTPSGTPRE